MKREPTIRGFRTGLTLSGLVVLVAGCGADTSYKNNPRPPSPITVTASIGAKRVIVSPNRFGAGPITLVVTNQTGRSRELVLQSNEEPGSGRTGPGAQTTGPINPQGTASLKADLTQGTYAVRVRDGAIRPARLSVGRERSSAQNQLLQP
jgi:hypothetical protein